MRGLAEVREWYVLVAGCVTLVCCVFLGCAAPGTAPTTMGDEPTARRSTPLLPSTGADIRGIITEVRQAPRESQSPGQDEGSAPDAPVSNEDARSGSPPGADGNKGAAAPIGVVLVEENPDEEAGSQKDSVTVTRATRLVEQRVHGLTSIRFDDIEVGQRIEAWYTGPVAESYPRQATARVIVVNPPTE